MLGLKKWRGGDSFLAIVRTMDSPIFVVEQLADGKFRFLHVSQQLLTTTGLEADHLYSGTVDRVFPARMASLIERNYERALASDTPICLDEAHRLSDKDTWWRTTLSRAPNGPGGQQRILGFTHEISELKTREAQLGSDLADLRLAHKEVKMLAGLTAHDMRAPLANVISLTGIVLEDFRDLGDGKRDMIAACRDVARSSIEAIDGIIHRVKSFDTLPDREESVDLGRACAGIAGLVDPGKKLDITYPNIVVRTDVVVLQACLRNLMDNAARYAASRICVTLEQDPSGQTIQISVTDDGPGIPPNTNPLTRNALSRSGTVRGFGLPTIQKLLNSLGGSLAYRPAADGTGTCFTAELPGHVQQDPDVRQIA